MSFFKKIIVGSFLGLILLASNWALLSSKFFRVHDYTHSARISQMSLALNDGHFPVRWVKDFGYGYGMPLFQFYAPLPYYFGSFFHLLGFEMIFILKLLFFTPTLVTMLGGYVLGKKLWGNWAGLLMASAMTLAPYRAVNLYVRGAISESWAIMFLPWILYGIILIVDKLAESKNQQLSKILTDKSWLILVFSLVGLFLSHNLTTLMFVPISLLFAFLYFGVVNKVFSLSFQTSVKAGMRSGLVLGLAYALAIGLSSFYLIPAFVEKGYTKVESMVLGGYFDYNLHFLYIRQFFDSEWGFGGSSWGVDDDISFFLGYGQLILIFTTVFFLFKKVWSHRNNLSKMFTGKLFLVSLVAMILFLSLFMSIMKSQFLWNSISLLAFIQFPWRWLSVAIIFAGILGGSMMMFFDSKVKRAFFSWLMILVMVIGNFYFFRPEKYLDDFNDFYYQDQVLIRRNMSGILEDYVPISLKKNIEPTLHLIDQENFKEEEISLLVDRTQEKLFSTNFSESRKIEINLADYPGWKVELNGESISHSKSSAGLIEVEIPEGNNLLALSFGSTPVRFWSDLISFLSICVVILMTAFKKVESQKNKIKDD